MVEYAKRIEKEITHDYWKEFVRKFIKTRNVNIANDFNTPILFIAIDLKEYNLAKLLLKNGTNPNYYNWNGFNSLIAAIHKRNFEMIKLLMKYGANPNYKENDYITPLEYAKNINN